MTRSIDIIDQRMVGLDAQSFRYHVLKTAKTFKTSWIDLGRALYAVWKDKKYKEWGYQTFETYTAKEIGIRKATSIKLLRSYSFLEKEEPEYLKDDHSQPEGVSSLPSYESIDILRLAKNKKISDNEYNALKEKVFKKGKEAHELRRDLTSIIREREELSSQEAFEQKKEKHVKRLLGTLKLLEREISESKSLPHAILKDIQVLIKRIAQYAD
ncbi:MAG: hypothetical protein ABIJ41_07450 [Candidatus Omnitrophota bacterium]